MPNYAVLYLRGDTSFEVELPPGETFADLCRWAAGPIRTDSVWREFQLAPGLEGPRLGPVMVRRDCLVALSEVTQDEIDWRIKAHKENEEHRAEHEKFHRVNLELSQEMLKKSRPEFSSDEDEDD